MNTIKAFGLYVAITGIAIFSACNKEFEALETDPETALHKVVFHAGWAPESKTVLQEDGSVWWEPGDEALLCVDYPDLHSTYFRKLVSTNKESAPEVDFVADITTEDQMVLKTYRVFYPYNTDNYVWSDDGNTWMRINIPKIQTAVPGAYDRSAFISYAESTDNILYFKNLCGGIKFSVSQEGIKAVSFKYTSGNSAMSGSFSGLYNMDDPFQPELSGDAKNNEVIVHAPDNEYLEVGKYYYAVMYPCDSPSPIMVTFIKDSTQATYWTTGPTEIKRSVFKRLLNKDEGLVFEEKKQSDGAVMTSMMQGVDFYSEREKITEVYFHPSSVYVTEFNVGTEDDPIYFEADGTIVHYYTPKHSFNIKNVSAGMFQQWLSLKKVDLTGVDTSEATDFSWFFGYCYNLEEINVSGFDTSSALDFSRMFSGCSRLESLDLSSFNTTNVVNMSSMFEGCRNLRNLDLGSFKTGRCVDMSFMFNYCVSLEKLDLANFDVSSVQNASMMSHNMTIHRKHCLIRASEATKTLLCGLYSDMPQAAKDYFITWIAPGEDFPAVEDPFAGLYKSTDYSKDMTFTCIQEASKGKGIDIVIMGDAYSDRLINDGTYDMDLMNAVNQIFSEEPLKSLRDYFNIYLTYAVSENETIAGVTALDLVFEDYSSHISGGDGIVDDYMRATLPNYGWEWTMGRPVPFIILLANTNIHAGTCAWFSSGSSLVYTTLGVDDVDFHAIQCHEFGHAIGKLADEYDEHGWTFDDSQSFIQKSSEGWHPNLDVTSDPNSVKWSHFLEDDRYGNQGLGVFEGGFADYAYGIWRPTENSIMRNAPTGFNAPCREAIYKRVHELSEDSFVYDYETFVAFDQPSWAGAPKPNNVIRNYDGRAIRPLPPPVFIKGTDNPNGASTTIHN